MFVDVQLIQTNKLKHYPSIHGDFSSEFRQPCVVFTGHPSLRFGDVVHFMELWGKSSLNTIIFTGNCSSLILYFKTSILQVRVCHCLNSECIDLKKKLKVTELC